MSKPRDQPVLINPGLSPPSQTAFKDDTHYTLTVVRGRGDGMVGFALYASQKQAKRSTQSCGRGRIRQMPLSSQFPIVGQMLALSESSVPALAAKLEALLQCRVGSSTEAIIHCQRQVSPASGEGTKAMGRPTRWPSWNPLFLCADAENVLKANVHKR